MMSMLTMVFTMMLTVMLTVMLNMMFNMMLTVMLGRWCNWPGGHFIVCAWVFIDRALCVWCGMRVWCDS